MEFPVSHTVVEVLKIFLLQICLIIKIYGKRNLYQLHIMTGLIKTFYTSRFIAYYTCMQVVKILFCLFWSNDCYNANPGGQATFYGSHKITV